jgi:hypothetical protein
MQSRRTTLVDLCTSLKCDDCLWEHFLKLHTLKSPRHVLRCNILHGPTLHNGQGVSVSAVVITVSFSRMPAFASQPCVIMLCWALAPDIAVLASTRQHSALTNHFRYIGTTFMTPLHFPLTALQEVFLF